MSVSYYSPYVTHQLFKLVCLFQIPLQPASLVSVMKISNLIHEVGILFSIHPTWLSLSFIVSISRDEHLLFWPSFQRVQAVSPGFWHNKQLNLKLGMFTCFDISAITENKDTTKLEDLCGTKLWFLLNMLALNIILNGYI